MAITLDQSGPAYWKGKQIGRQDIFFQRTGQEAEYLSASFWSAIVMSIPELKLIDHIKNISNEDPDEVLNSQWFIPSQQHNVNLLRNSAISLLNMALQPIISPRQSSDIASLTDTVVEQIALNLASAPNNREPHLSHRHQSQIIKKVVDYCMNRVEKPIRIGELCRELNFIERTLLHAFQQRLNLTPSQYLKALKLNRIYKKLRKPDQTEIQIKEIALANVFFHMGQFSQDYKRLFGELPSDTLRSY